MCVCVCVCVCSTLIHTHLSIYLSIRSECMFKCQLASSHSDRRRKMKKENIIYLSVYLSISLVSKLYIYIYTYLHRICSRRTEFKSWTRQFILRIVLITYGKLCFQLFSLQLVAEDKRTHIFWKLINLQVNVIFRLEFELAYKNVVTHGATGTPPVVKQNYFCNDFVLHRACFALVFNKNVSIIKS